MSEEDNMKICIPTFEERGLAGEPYGHFGSAPYFLLYDSETKKTETINNGDEHHVHGACNPLKTLGGGQVDALIVGGIGGRAIEGLNAMGIRVYRSVPGTIRDNVESLAKGELLELTAADACGHHNSGCHS
jgi:predicted Fe-Mo cluster-binding NifX family protein